MMREQVGFMLWFVMAGLVGILAMGGCSKKNVVATTSGTEIQQPGAGASKPSVGDSGKPSGGDAGQSGRGDTGIGGTKPGGESSGSGSEPLRGFGKTPGEESVKTPPMVVAKADQAEIDARKAREAAKRELVDIYFAFDKWALSSEGKKNLAESAEFLKQNHSVKLLIEGHCDERGSREYNLVLGEKRAKETQRYLMDLGIKNPVSINSFGKERPVCTEPDESCYWKNRRAHLVVETGK